MRGRIKPATKTIEQSLLYCETPKLKIVRVKAKPSLLARVKDKFEDFLDNIMDYMYDNEESVKKTIYRFASFIKSPISIFTPYPELNVGDLEVKIFLYNCLRLYGHFVGQNAIDEAETLILYGVAGEAGFDGLLGYCPKHTIQPVNLEIIEIGSHD